MIPTEVQSELSSPNRPSAVRAFIATAPPWLVTRAPSQPAWIPNVDPGELAAISLAMELKADLLLIDDAKGREAAIARHIPVARTAAVLFEAASQGVLPDLAAAFEGLKQTNFRVPAAILDKLLELHLKDRPRQSP